MNKAKIPVIFLAFANDRDDRVQYLRNLPEEARRLQKALAAAEQSQQCEVVVRQNATLEDILDVFQNGRYRGRIAVFHFGGHANGYQLLLESAKGQPALAHAEGLARFLGQHPSLRLIFLNGCSTRQQVEGLLSAQIPAVIATAQAIDDEVAMEFSSRLYRGLGSGADLQTAYQEAEAALQIGKGSNQRGLYYLADETEPAPKGWPWALYLQPTQEAGAHWRLPQSGLELFEEKPRQPFEPEMVYIPAGSFTIGSDQGESHEKPPHEVTLKAYFISSYPITNRRYLEYVQATGAPVPAAGWRLASQGMEPPPEKLDHPVVGVTWDEARAYCDWLRDPKQTGRHYRLPTEAEWEKAARGPVEARTYPWGEDFDPACCNNGGSGTTPVGNYPQGDSPYGCADMAGNVWEWAQTRWGSNYSAPDQRYPYKTDQRENLKAQTPHREYRLIRGGSYLDEPGSLRCSARSREAADERSPSIGFRVVIELPQAQEQES